MGNILGIQRKHEGQNVEEEYIKMLKLQQMKFYNLTHIENIQFSSSFISSSDLTDSLFEGRNVYYTHIYIYIYRNGRHI